MNSLYEDSVRRSDPVPNESLSASPSKQKPPSTKTPSRTDPRNDRNDPKSDRSDPKNDPSDSSPPNKQMRHDELFRLYLVFQEMRTSGVQADAAVYNTLINACAGVGDLEKALETVQAMQVGHTPSPYVTIIT